MSESKHRLALTAEQREAVQAAWEGYEREGSGFAYTAAGRLAVASEPLGLEVAIGTFQGGEYLLHMHVAEAALPDLRDWETFEGFRVLWLASSQ